MTLDASKLDLCSPKRSTKGVSGWDGFFPYYAGFPETFATRVLRSAGLSGGNHVLDPWNGSGTTTSAASAMGVDSTGVDINPSMIVVAKARALARSEAVSLGPLCRELLLYRSRTFIAMETNDELAQWFGPATARWIRSMECAIRNVLLPRDCEPFDAEHISAIASTYYVALFALCRQIAARFQSSNPTWLRSVRNNERRIGIPSVRLEGLFGAIVASMAEALAVGRAIPNERAVPSLMLGDTSRSLRGVGEADFILTSPPYCTRIDYTAATRLPLAVMKPLAREYTVDLSRRMMGSTRVPTGLIEATDAWGSTCNTFLRSVARHPSKASSTYYLKTHLDYFHKLFTSISLISARLSPSGTMVMVVQDSHYKEVHNDLTTILSEMAGSAGLVLKRRDDFPLARTLAGTNPHTRAYRSSGSANEAVLVFQEH